MSSVLIDDDDFLVPNQLTHLSAAEAGLALWQALQHVLIANGDVLNPACRVPALALLMAHSAHETGRWRACHNNNLGNLKAGRSTHKRCEFRASERRPDGSTYERLYRWRAYDTPVEGALDMVRFIGADTDGDGINRYTDAWDELLSGSARMYALALSDAGYYTDDRETYAASLRSLQHDYVPVAREIISDV